MTLTTWLSLVALCGFGAMSPGPSLAVVLRQTLNNGRRHGIATACAHAFGVALWAVLTIQGLALLITQTPLLYQLLTYAGAAYLAWLGVRALRARGGIRLELHARPGSLGAAARDGLMISLLNPKLAIFFLALFTQYVAAEQSPGEQLLLVATVAGIDSLWYILIALLLSQSGLIERLRRNAATLDRVSGLILIALALRVVTL